MGTIQASIDGAVEYLREHPDEARYRDGPATATASADAGLRVVVSGTSGESVATDMVTAVGGGGTAPSPGWLFRAAQASCVATLIRMRAEMLDVDVGAVEVTVDSESDDRGILGIDPDVVAGRCRRGSSFASARPSCRATPSRPSSAGRSTTAR